MGTEVNTRQEMLLVEIGVAARDAEFRRRLLEALLRPVKPPQMTYEEFLAWADEDTLAEWEDGAVMMYGPVSNKHEDIADFLLSVLRIFTETRGLGIVRSAPFQMKLERTGREPDVLFLSTEHLGRLKETYLDGPADLAVEIISPESIDRDRGKKFYEYARGGVGEYWLIDPDGRWAEFYVLGPEERYRLVMEGREGEYRSRVIEGFWLNVAWLWQPPPVLAVVRELGLLP